jgi:putative transposase
VARKLRLQYPGAIYHVINRGNYRWDVFGSEGGAAAFEETMWEAVARCGWQLHAYVVMSNHYHLAVTTPDPNLVEGMQWLQSTYATRFNRFRNVRGHLFQGRYKALIVEPGEALFRLVNYIHLNPVRAKIVPPERVGTYRWSSLRQFVGKGERSPGSEAVSWLKACGRADDPEDWQWYLRWLIAIGGDEDAQRRQGLVDLGAGWAIGTQGWRKAIAEEHAHLALNPGLDKEEVAQLREAQWEKVLRAELKRRRKTPHDAASAAKGADWKVEIAVCLRRECLAPNAWIAERLQMGRPGAVSALVGRRLRRTNLSSAA